jgi:hypothetical protein
VRGATVPLRLRYRLVVRRRTIGQGLDYVAGRQGTHWPLPRPWGPRTPARLLRCDLLTCLGAKQRGARYAGVLRHTEHNRSANFGARLHHSIKPCDSGSLGFRRPEDEFNADHGSAGRASTALLGAPRDSAQRRHPEKTYTHGNVYKDHSPGVRAWRADLASRNSAGVQGSSLQRLGYTRPECRNRACCTHPECGGFVFGAPALRIGIGAFLWPHEFPEVSTLWLP